MRCLVLAGALAQQGATGFCLPKSQPGHLCDGLNSAVFTVSDCPVSAVSSDAAPGMLMSQDDVDS